MRFTRKLVFALVGISLLVSTYMPIATATKITAIPTGAKMEKSKKKEFLAVEISLPNKPKYKVPILLTGKKSGLMPVESSKLHGIKFIPYLQGNKVMLDIFAVTDSLKDITTCEQLKGLKTTLVASYSGQKGDIIRVTALKKFAVASFTVAIVAMSEEEGGAGCCTCNGIQCCPYKGRCMDCNGCGLCCQL